MVGSECSSWAPGDLPQLHLADPVATPKCLQQGVLACVCPAAMTPPQILQGVPCDRALGGVPKFHLIQNGVEACDWFRKADS
jgi:hypothetical protein